MGRGDPSPRKEKMELAEYFEMSKKDQQRRIWNSRKFLNSLDRKKYYEELEYKEKLDYTLIVLI